MENAYPVYPNYSPSPLPQLPVRRKEPDTKQYGGNNPNNHHWGVISIVINGLLLSAFPSHPKQRPMTYPQRENQSGLDSSKGKGHRKAREGGLPHRPFPIP